MMQSVPGGYFDLLWILYSSNVILHKCSIANIYVTSHMKLGIRTAAENVAFDLVGKFAQSDLTATMSAFL